MLLELLRRHRDARYFVFTSGASRVHHLVVGWLVGMVPIGLVPVALLLESKTMMLLLFDTNTHTHLFDVHAPGLLARCPADGGLLP